LEHEIKIIRETGIAFDLEEHTLGISAVGTSIIGPEGEIAAISIPTPSVRFADKKQELEAALRDCRRELIEKLGNV
jgi:DNA-binding IclR family transcriptional regulator